MDGFNNQELKIRISENQKRHLELEKLLIIGGFFNNQKFILVIEKGSDNGK